MSLLLREEMGFGRIFRIVNNYFIINANIRDRSNIVFSEGGIDIDDVALYVFV